jgi:hypothetical protein
MKFETSLNFFQTFRYKMIFMEKLFFEFYRSHSVTDDENDLRSFFRGTRAPTER